jgi:hypothetical protein
VPQLYVNGDSWSWSNNLDDPTLWPNIVAHKTGLSIENQAMGCGSNSRIVDSLYNSIAVNEKPELAIIMLTAHHRTHMPAANMGAWSIGPQVAINDRTGEVDDTIRNWVYARSYDLVDSMYRYYRDIWKMHSICTKYSIPIWFFQSWDPDPAEYNALNDPNELLKHCEDSYNSEQYAKAFKFLQIESKQWRYIEKPLCSDFVPEDYNHTKHPSTSGHAKIANQVLNFITGKI